MLVLGLELQLRGEKPPVLRAVLLQDGLPSGSTPALSDITVVGEPFDLGYNETDWGKLCAAFGHHAASSINSLRPDRVVVRRADNSPAASRANGSKLRLLIDGAVTAAAFSEVSDTLLLTGEECAIRYGTAKAALDSDGKKLASNSHGGAAAAALAGITKERF